MHENVVRAFTRWGIRPADGDPIGMALSPCEENSAFYRPNTEEALVSLMISSEVAHQLSVRIFLRRFRRENEKETIVGMVPAITFMENSRNRAPFHGAVDERDEYEVEFLNISNVELYISAAVLVHQP